MHTARRDLICLATIAVGLWSSVASAGKPELTHTRLFENHKTEAARLAALGPDGKSFKRHHNGMVNYRIPAMAISTKGTIIAMCNGRTGTGLDQCEYCTIVARRSTDGGKTWEPETTVMEIPYRSIFTGSAIVDPTTGEIMFFCNQWPMKARAKKLYTDPKSDKAYEGFGILRSRDDGKTWKFERFKFKPGKLLTGADPSGSDTGFMISKGPYKGRLIIPARSGTSVENMEKFCEKNHLRMNWYDKSKDGKPRGVGCNTVVYSDDHGKTWTIGGIERPGTGEACLAELSDGTLYLDSRIPGGFRVASISKDGGENFTDPTVTPVICPNSGCAASVITVPREVHGRRLLILTTPTHNEFGWSMFRDRKEFTAFVSFDDGKTWPVRKLINEGPSGYSVSVMDQKGNFLVLYEKGKAFYRDTGISIVKFNIQWLLDGKDINSFQPKSDASEQRKAPIVALRRAPASGAEPEHMQLFKNDGKTFYRTPALVKTNKGTLIAVSNACDSPPVKESTHAAIVARRSDDGGKTWGAMQTILDAKNRRMKTGAGVVDTSTGEIMFFCAAWSAPRTLKPGEASEERMIQSRSPWGRGATTPFGKSDANPIDKYVGYGILRSKDDGATWKFEKTDIGIPNASYGFINTSGGDTGVVIRSGPKTGRLLVPVCATGNQQAIYKFLHARRMRIPWMQRAPYFPYCGTSIYSDDHGKTWQASGFGSVMAAESCLAELPDGSIYLNAAASGGWRVQCRSKDSGATWEKFALSYLRDGHSGCAGSIVSLSKEAGARPCLVLTAPGHNESGFDSRRDRKKFTANVSFDGGKTWPIKKLINEGPSGYSASIVGKDGAVFVLYEKGDKVYYDKGVSIVRLDPKWLLGNKSK